jgi:uncharacterized protein
LLLAEEVIRMMGRSSDDYLRRDRSQFNDMFVSCGRPVMPNGRSDATAQAGMTHFQLLSL